ncbi:ATP-dependent helicase HrpB [Radicibacter daui]|uniref:ATP-dependent helicase HrpB n=1 Tax=Radicibacter daui TaxID=3064829 RepID=UPI004046E841
MPKAFSADGSLPIDGLLPDIAGSLAATPNLVLQAPPGAGKTTRVPLALLEAPWLAGKSLLMLEPRRLATRAAARRMASTLGERPGERVGYRVHMDSKVGPATRIEVITEAILTRRLIDDPSLEGVGCVIFDEVHERNLSSDLGLALCLEVQQGLRDDLRLLAMSATLDGERFARLMGGAPVITSEGRAFPVEVRYRPGDGRLAERTATAIRAALKEETGSVLVFLPGMGEIRRTQGLLGDLGPQVDVLPLHGSLPVETQDAAISPAGPGRRKVVLSTDIAETSLTIEGVRVVIDGGQRRTALFDPRSGMTRLETRKVSRAAAEQRTGRAGRVEPGVAYRLWSEAEHRALAAYTAPEILEADLAPLALDLALWGTRDAATLAWIDAPPAGPMAQATELLTELGALGEDGAITLHGRAMATLPLHPRLAHMVLAAERQEGASGGDGALAAALAALLSERDSLAGAAGRGADIRPRLDLLRERAQGAPPAAHAIRQNAGEIRRRAGIKGADWNSARAGAVLALAYPDRLAQQRGGAGRFRLSGGKGAVMDALDPLAASEFLVVADLAGGEEARIQLAAPVSLFELPPPKNVSAIYWDHREKAVAAHKQSRIGALVLKQSPLHKPDPAAVTEAMIAGVQSLGIECLSWTPALRQWQARVNLLARTLPEQGWPAVDDIALMGNLERWLAPYLTGLMRAEHLSRLDLSAALEAMLEWPQRQALADLAPTHFTVPSGDGIRLDYLSGDVPLLAVKLQALFGLTETPRIAGGRVPLLIEPLSPGQRPLARTQDLASFWTNAYPEIRKEMRGRYPKHPWPDDPFAMPATMRTKASLDRQAKQHK